MVDYQPAVAYAKRLDQVYPILTTPKKCMNLHCDKRPSCYTDYQPHYEQGYNLSNLVVGNRSWTYIDGKNKTPAKLAYQREVHS